MDHIIIVVLPSVYMGLPTPLWYNALKNLFKTWKQIKKVEFANTVHRKKKLVRLTYT